ncbi:uncharacterized protein EURHEDRAFT_383166 [Aspergillus ruber CBS 135680]|uniref:Uncharacterized protein n=1 Tax=Aspergillus ruber (strain CBS 135680) TaxID=1388766 RepID=A0A017SPV2_ASPRC|nr:uncharacterized protein EURHEDRAFT_383166 [Aspergillus ruber CBS 135680]EYE98977.1 hypothetical protein EURHEDRAFT_383166 [Aspergillus ruber CBS 135680]
MRDKERPISSERDLEGYERSAVENHMRNIIAELCKIPTARDEFRLGDGVQFDSHANGIDLQTNQPSRSGSSRPDQYCIHRIDDGTSALLTTVEYKPPHKLPVESLHRGLKSIDFWEQMVKAHGVLISRTRKLKGSLEVNPEDDQSFLQPATAIARVLCLCLMSFRSRLRSQQWRNEADAQLPIWKSSFGSLDGTWSTVSEFESPQSIPNSKHTYPSPKSTTSEFLPPSSSSAESPTAEGRRAPTRSRPGCSPFTATHHDKFSDSDSDFQASSQRKRGFSKVGSSPPVQRVHNARFCTQQCLHGLQQGDLLDDACPNVMLHKQGGDGRRHAIDFTTLVQLVKRQLGDNIDRNCTPMGDCEAPGALFKLTCAAYGYTVVGKGTTCWWPELLREAEVYRVLQQAQGSAVPVFLGAIDLKKTYFLHGAGAIRHMPSSSSGTCWG